jgi:hypothetical protein
MAEPCSLGSSSTHSHFLVGGAWEYTEEEKGFVPVSVDLCFCTNESDPTTIRHTYIRGMLTLLNVRSGGRIMIASFEIAIGTHCFCCRRRAEKISTASESIYMEMGYVSKLQSHGGHNWSIKIRPTI